MSERELAIQLLDEQNRRWGQGDCVPVEDYLLRYPCLRCDEEATLDLIRNEMRWRAKLGTPRPATLLREEYLRRFPTCRAKLQLEFDWDEVCPEIQGNLCARVDASPKKNKEPAGARAGAGTEADDNARVRGGYPSIPGFEILEELGRGAMGVVYRARQLAPERIVALKMLRAGQLASPSEVQRFNSEAEKVARLDHAHGVPIYGVGEYRPDGEGAPVPYFFMKLMEGGSLQKNLGRIRLPVLDRKTGRDAEGKVWSKAEFRERERDVARLLTAVAAAVQHAHERGILHIDLKPANILLDADGRPHVADFGLARCIEGGGNRSTSLIVGGTPGYMAPEQAEGKKDVSTATDVFGLGAILYFLLTGGPPFRGDGPAETVLQGFEIDPDRPRSRNPNISRDLETICLKCLEKVPRDRYSGAEALAADLARWLRGEPIQARPVPTIRRAWYWVCRRPALAALAGLMAMVAVLVPAMIVGYQAQVGAILREKELVASHARDEAYLRLVASIPDPFSRPSALPWESLDKLRRAAALQTSLRRPVELRTLAAECYATVDLRQTEAIQEDFTVSALAYSPDGSRLALGHFGPVFRPLPSLVIRMVELSSRETTEVFLPTQYWDRSKDAISQLAFSPDGRTLAVGTRAGAIHCVNFTAWPPSAVGHSGTHDGPVDALAFSPDGRTLATASGDGIVKTWNVRQGLTFLVSTKLSAPSGGVAFSPNGETLVCSTMVGLRVLDARTLGPRVPPRELASWHSQLTTRIALSSHGQTLACTKNYGILLGELREDSLVRELWDTEPGKAHEHPINSLCFSADGALLLSAAWDRKVKVWEVATGRLLVRAIADAGGADITVAAFQPDGRGLAVTGNERTLLYELKGLRERTIVAQHGKPIRAMAYSPDGQRLACIAGAGAPGTGCFRGELTFWDAKSGKLFQGAEIDAHFPSSGLWSPALAFDGSGALLAYNRSDTEVAFRSLDASRPAPPPVRGRLVSHLRFGGNEGLLWMVSAGKVLMAFRMPEGYEAGRWDNTLGEWMTGRPRLTSLAVGKCWVLVGSADEQARLFRADGSLAAEWPSPYGSVEAVAISPDERLGALGCRSGCVRLVHLPAGEVVADLVAHHNQVSALAFCEDGQLLATGGDDGRLRLWLRHGSSFRELVTLRVPSGTVKDLCFSPDGTRLAVLGRDEQAITVWHLERLNESLRRLGIGW